MQPMKLICMTFAYFNDKRKCKENDVKGPNELWVEQPPTGDASWKLEFYQYLAKWIIIKSILNV